jgi:hypothetical protein
MALGGFSGGGIEPAFRPAPLVESEVEGGGGYGTLMPLSLVPLAGFRPESEPGTKWRPAFVTEVESFTLVLVC